MKNKFNHGKSQNLELIGRAVHGSGRSGLCPTRNRPARDRVGRCPTYNRTAGDRVLQVGFPSGERSVLGEAETHWKPPKRGENRRDLSRSVQDLVQSSRIWQRFCQIQCFFPQIVPRIVEYGVLVVEICQILLENLSKSLN